ncbi:hypothetical protein JCM10449v2_007234 [Rhodotorula kratochvilovae]
MVQRRTKRSARLRAAAAVSLLACAPSTSASFLDSLRARALLPRAATVVPNIKASLTYSNASAALPTVVDATNEGRYGHSAVYLPPPANELLLIGGQVGENGTTITNEVLRFRLASTFLWGDRPVSAIPDNPAKDTALAAGLPATAWAAAAVDAQARPWLVGGVTADCEADGIAHVLDTGSSSWAVPALSSRYPPRRRQASAVAVANATTGGTDVWVFGGIADEFTCSSETIGYAGIDRYDTVSGVVESMPWNAPGGVAPSEWEPPVSDYSATALADGSGVVVIGGQASDGHLADTMSVLVFDVATRSWVQQAASNVSPSPRMGHAAVHLPSGSILVHGGFSSAHAVLSDMFLLSPSFSGWTWTELLTSDHSMAAPALAYHTATQVAGGTIVVAFGIDGATSAPSSAFWFLEVDEAAGTYTWTDTFEGNADALAAASMNTSASSAARLAKRAIDVVTNPKASTSTSAYIEQPTAASGGYYGGYGADTGAQASVAAWSSSSSSSAARAAVASTAVPAKSPSSAASSAEEDDAPTPKSTIIGASIGAVGAAVAAAGLLFFLFRRRAAQAAPATPMMGSTGDGSAPFVSQLLYTRPAQARNLSLGSTVSALSPRADSLLPDSPNVAGIGAGGGLGTSADPFSDAHRVNEVGQLERAGSAASSTGGVVGALAASISSVLGSPRAQEQAPDSYTSPAPTLAAKRGGSIRRAPPPLPLPIPVPGTPAELIGVAITSDDGHDGLPYLASTSSAAAAGGVHAWDPAVQAQAARTPSPPQSEIREVRAVAAGVPPALRPGTPLRVANPDPFSDP